MSEKTFRAFRKISMGIVAAVSGVMALATFSEVWEIGLINGLICLMSAVVFFQPRSK